MSVQVKYPRVKTIDYDAESDRLHLAIEVTYSEGDAPQKFCGYSWCTGECNLPALVMTITGPTGEHDTRELKAYSSMTACGQMMQPWRVKWSGGKTEVKSGYEDYFRKAMWI